MSEPATPGPNASSAVYVFSDTNTSKEVSHFHLVVPPCVDAELVTAVDCNGAPLEVAVGQYAGCFVGDFPTLLDNETVVKIDTNNDECSGTLNVTVLSAVGNIGGAAHVFIG